MPVPNGVPHPDGVAALLDGHPDDWWDGHDWEYWWSRLSPGDRARLLELGWGEEPAPLLGIILTSLRGAVYETVEDYMSSNGGYGMSSNGGYGVTKRRVVQRATDEFMIWLEEKRAESGRL